MIGGVVMAQINIRIDDELKEKAELILRADEMKRGSNIEIHELIEIQEDD